MGGALATEFALTDPSNLKSLILASPLISVKHWIQDANNLRQKLPISIQETLTKHEAEGTVNTQEYEDATMEFYRRYVCRLDPWPEDFQYAFEHVSLPVYRTMWGPAEFNMNGNLSDFERIDQLHEIKCPVLLTCGYYDEATPSTMQLCKSKLQNGQLTIFKDSSHMPHLEETTNYLQVLKEFFLQNETSA